MKYAPIETVEQLFVEPLKVCSFCRGCGSASLTDPDPAFHFNTDPDPAFYLSAYPNPDPASLQSDVNPRPLDYRPSRALFLASMPPLGASKALNSPFCASEAPEF
jgi:hypothetical protein